MVAGAVANAGAAVAGSGPAQILASRARGGAGTPMLGSHAARAANMGAMQGSGQQQQGHSSALWGAAGGEGNAILSVFDKSSAARLDLESPSPRVSGAGTGVPLVLHPSSPNPHSFPANREGSSSTAAGRGGMSSSTPQLCEAALPTQHLTAYGLLGSHPSRASPGTLASPHTSITITPTTGPMSSLQLPHQQQHQYTHKPHQQALPGIIPDSSTSTMDPGTHATCSSTPAPTTHASLRFEDMLPVMQHAGGGAGDARLSAAGHGGGHGTYGLGSGPAAAIWSVYKDMPVVAPPTLATTAANRNGSAPNTSVLPGLHSAGGAPGAGALHPASTIAKQVSEPVNELCCQCLLQESLPYISVRDEACMDCLEI